MEVIKSGKDLRSEVTCPHCLSRIAYHGTEILTRIVGVQRTMFGMEPQRDCYITCPECHKDITL